MAQDARWETLPAALAGIVLLAGCGALGMAHSADQDVWAEPTLGVEESR